MTTMNTGDISRRLGVQVTAEQLTELGFEPVGKDKRAVLWDARDYPAMCERFGNWIKGRANVPMQPKPEGKTKAKAESKAPPAADDDDEL